MNEFRQQPNGPSGSPAEPTVVFVADAHFHLKPDADEQERLDRFCDFLVWARDADRLVLMGDIFDFWFDYPHFRLKGYEQLLQALDAVRAAGCALTFIGGNHDIWAADYMHRRYGCPADAETCTLDLGRRRVLLSHGDGLLKFDWAYSAFRALVRTRAGVLLAKSFHPEFLFALSTWLSGHSRAADRDHAAELDRLARRWFAREPVGDWDLMITGHIHHAVHLRDGKREFAALAGWFSPLGYGLLQDGEFRLLDFAAPDRPDLSRR